MNQEVSSSSSFEGSSDDTGSDYSDTESNGDVIEETKCLFCDTVSNTPEECLLHIKLVHDLDIV